jgi:hypothetical protein
MTDPRNEPSPEDPTRFPSRPRIAPLDEAPDGRTPSDPDEPTPGSLPPGADGMQDQDESEG